MSPVWDNSCQMYFISGCRLTLLWHSHSANSNNGALRMDTRKSGWCCNLPVTVVCGQVVMLTEYTMHSCKIYSTSYLSSFHYPHGNSPGCFCARRLEKQDCDLEVIGFSPWNQMEISGVWKYKRDNFPFIKHMCKSSTGTAQRPTGREWGCSGAALMCECVEINQCGGGIFD